MRFFVQMRIPNGARDVDLLRDLDAAAPEFATDTLRPSAAWFLHQIDFPTSLNFLIMSRKVVRMQDHLDMVLKVQGTFFEQLELNDYPLDVQALTLCLSFQVAAPDCMLMASLIAC